ncbi:Obscurin-like protein 1 isoform X1 [Aix galericulata]|nr:Obscurin-like protein 1 isoform X1 [Aix galericulata]
MGQVVASSFKTKAPVRIVSSNEGFPHAYTAGQRVELWCQLSRAEAPVCWYKDGEEVQEGESLVLEREGTRCRLVLPCARPQDAGEFVCDAGGDSVFYTITVAGGCAAQRHPAPSPPALASPLVPVLAPCCPTVGCSSCSSSAGPAAPSPAGATQSPHSPPCVWARHGDSAPAPILLVPPAPPARIAPVPEAQRLQEVLVGLPVLLECEVSPEGAPVRWLKDGEAVEPSETLAIQSEGCLRRLHIPTAALSDSGTYTCDAGDDAASFRVTVTEAPVRIVSSNEGFPHAYTAGQRVELWCQLSRAEAPVCWYKDGEEVQEGESLVLEREGTRCRLVLPCARPQDTGEFICDAGDTSVSYHVVVAEPRVRILHPAQRSLELAVQAPGRVELRCELSVPDAPVRWFKDGLEVDESHNLRLLAEGARRCLLIPRSSAEDTGEYICESKDEAVSFDVKVSEPPVTILQPRRPPPVVKASPGDTVTLACELSRTDAAVRWAKEGVRLEAGGSLVLEEEGAQRRLLIPAARAEHSGRYVCDAGDDTVTFTVQVSGERGAGAWVLGAWTWGAAHPWVWGGVVVGGGVIPSAPRPRAAPWHGSPRAGPRTRGSWPWLMVAVVLSGAADPPVRILERDALLTRRHCRAMEDLVLEVRLSHAHGEVKWYKDGEKLQDTGHVRLEEDGARRSLLILGATGGDAGEYLCDTRDDSIIFCVSVEEPPVTIVGNTGATEHRCLVAGEDLVLACELSRPDAAVRWLRDGREVQLGERVQAVSRGALRELTVRAAQPGDSGCYVCDAASDRMVTSVEVAAQPVRILNKEEAQSPLEVLEGDSVTLVARLSPETAAARWQKDGQTLRSGGRLLVCSEGPARSLTIKQAELGDAGVFLCDAGDDEVNFTLHVKGKPAETSPMGQDWCSSSQHQAEPLLPVTEAPVLFVNKQEEREKLLVLEGGSAVLSAVVSKEGADVTWLGPQQHVVAGERCQLRQDGRVHSLVLCNVAKEDAGVYTCLSPHDQMQFDVSVRELQVKFLRGLSDVRARQGETVVLWCELCKARGDVVWLKDGRPLAPGARREVRVQGRERSLVLSRVGPEDAGEYCCESNDDRTLATLTVQVPRVVEIVAELHSLTVLEGDDATFKCMVSPEDVAVAWQLNGQPVVPSERLLVARSGLCHSLTIRRCQPADAATVTANAEGLLSTARLSVQEAQVLFVRKLRDVVAEEEQDACLEVEVSHEAAEVQWLKQGVLLQPSGKHQLQESGRRRTLTIRSVSPADRGTYRCESLHDRTQAKLSVERECRRAPRGRGRGWGHLLLQGCCREGLCSDREVSIRRPLADVETFEKETATFLLELSHAGVPGVWARGGVRVKPSGTCRISATGCTHSLTLEGLTLQDSGTVSFTTDTLRCSARLIVRGTALGDTGTQRCLSSSWGGGSAQQGHSGHMLAQPPITMLKLPRDQGVPESGVATFECELSRPTAEVKWLKVSAHDHPVQADSSTLIPQLGLWAGQGGHAALPTPPDPVTPRQDGRELRPGPHCRIYSVGRRRLLQLSCCELPDAGVYTCDAGDCQASAALHVHGTAPGHPPSAEVLAARPVPAPRPCPAEHQVRVVQELQDARLREGDNAVFTCEVSHGDVAGEWFRDGEKIKVSSTVKIRQEGAACALHRAACMPHFGAGRAPLGPRHFLLLCAVRPEDAGRIRFVARTAASEASLQVEGNACVGWPGSSAVAVTRAARGVPVLMSLPRGVPVLMSLPRTPALPIRIVKPLRDKTVLARHKATLECTVSHARGRVRWLRGDTEIFAGDKYEICNLDCYRTLIIHRVGPEDEDSYTCDAFDDRSTARLLVEGERGGGPTGTGLCWEPPAVTPRPPWLLRPPLAPWDADWLCPHRELGAGMQHGDGQMAVLGDGVTFPLGHTQGDHLHPAPAPWLCIKQPVFFLTWLLPPQRWVPAQHGQAAGPHGAQTSGSRSPPAPRRSPHRGTPAPKGSLLCGRGLSSVWHIYKRGWEGGRRRGAADTAWQKHAAPGAAPGDEMAPRGGAPCSGPTAVLPAGKSWLTP